MIVIVPPSVHRTQPSSPPRFSYPTFDREARERFAYRCATELTERGFEVVTCQDVVNDRIIVKVRKGNLMYCEDIGYVEFIDDLCLNHVLQRLADRIEKSFEEAEKESNDA